MRKCYNVDVDRQRDGPMVIYLVVVAAQSSAIAAASSAVDICCFDIRSADGLK